LFSLGGFLAQKFADYTHHCPRVLSLVLCNSFTDTSVFQYGDSAPLYVFKSSLQVFQSSLFLKLPIYFNFSLWMLPSMVLKKMVMGNFGSEKMDVDVADAVDFMVEKVNCVLLLRKYCRVFGKKGSNL